jgi:hypothetical protein
MLGRRQTLLEKMRDFKGMKRQRSRNRGNGGGKPQHNANRAFESNGPEGVKIRGAAQHVFEKYQQLARDALTAGDRVLAESYQQHAEHYFRVLRAVQPQRSAQDIIGRDAFASGYDIDFEDDGGGEGETSESEAEGDRVDGRAEWRSDNRYENRDRQRDDRPRDDRQRDDRPRDDRQRDDRPSGERPRDDRQRDDRPRERNFNRDDRPRNERNDRYRDDRPREDRARDDRSREDRPRDETPREDRSRDDRPREDRTREDRPRQERQRFDRSERVSDPLAVVEPQASPLTSAAEPSSSPILRSQDGGVSEAPAFLQARPELKPEAVADAGEARPKPRRRRAPRDAETTGGEETAPTAAEEA